MNAGQVTLVIPGRNCARTIERCLEAVLPHLHDGTLREIIFVNDGSTDRTAEIVDRYPVKIITGEGRGPGAARNLGWRAARTELIYFLDSDCVARPDALPRLLAEMDDPEVAGAGGSYDNMLPDDLLACLIHEEIVARHRRMPGEIGYLATFSVVYRRAALEEIDGFDESLRTAEDADLAFRLRKAGYRLRFDFASRVGHYHPVQLKSYLRTQARHGFYRALMYRRHPDRMQGDSYSNLLDHLQPPLAMLLAAGWPLAIFPWGRWALVLGMQLLWLATLPLSLRLVAQTGQLRYLCFAPLAFVRAFARGVGLTAGVLAAVRRPAPAVPAQAAPPLSRAA